MAPLSDAPPAEDLLRVTPAGHLLPTEGAGKRPVLGPAVMQGLDGFRHDTSSGLFGMAAGSFSGGLPPQLAWCRDLASRYLGEICHTPADTAHIAYVRQKDMKEVRTEQILGPDITKESYLQKQEKSIFKYRKLQEIDVRNTNNR